MDAHWTNNWASTRMILGPDEPAPTHLGVLTLANQPTDFLPGAYVQFLKLDGPTLADDVLDEAAFTGRVTDVIRAVEEKLSSHNRTMVEFRSQATERPHPALSPCGHHTTVPQCRDAPHL